MKTKFLYLLVLIFSFFQMDLSAHPKGSYVVERDSVLPYEGYYLILNGSLGLNTGSTWNYWENAFGLNLLGGTGIEIPFTENHITAMEFFVHHWIARSYSGKSEYSPKLFGHYFHNGGFSYLFKLYFVSNKHRFRFAVRIGGVTSVIEDYRSLELGYSFNYRMSEKIKFSLERRVFLNKPNFAGNSIDAVPNMIMLNVGYMLKMN